MDLVAIDHHIKMNYANPQEHVPEAERNIRVVKERVRVGYHRLPFNHLPRIMVKYLACGAAAKLNFFPAKHGVSKYYSPRMILHQKNLDYKKDCQYSIGMYVQGHDELNITNTNTSRTLDCIYLRPHSTAQGGHELLHLDTNKVITQRRVTEHVSMSPRMMQETRHYSRSRTSSSAKGPTAHRSHDFK
jgi:hypothetical protein